MRFLPFSLVLVMLISGCGESVRIFNDQGLDEQTLATVTTQEEEGEFGTFMAFKSVDGESIGGPFDTKVETVKVTPGRHKYEIKFHDNSSVLGSVQYLITFEFNAVAGHEYLVHMVVSKPNRVAKRFFLGGDLSAWIEDTTTGEKIPIIQPNTR